MDAMTHSSSSIFPIVLKQLMLPVVLQSLQWNKCFHKEPPLSGILWSIPLLPPFQGTRRTQVSYCILLRSDLFPQTHRHVVSYIQKTFSHPGNCLSMQKSKLDFIQRLHSLSFISQVWLFSSSFNLFLPYASKNYSTNITECLFNTKLNTES